LLFALALPSCSKKDTTGVTRCDNEGYDLIAFSSDRGHPGQYDLYLFDAVQSAYRLLKDLNHPTASDSSPALSADGQLVAFVSARGTSGTDLYVYERLSCGFVSTPGLNGPGDETEPVFTGDTRRLAFVRDTLGHRRIRLVNGGSITYEALPGLDTLAAFGDWSPAPDRTGDRIAFVSDREGGPHLYLYERAGRRVDSLSALRVPGARDLDPAMTPDGRYLCFASDRPGGRGGFDLYLFDLTSQSFVSLPGINTARDERSPSVGRTCSYIAFQSDSSSSPGRDVRYYSRAGKIVASPGQLSGTGDDLHPSGFLPEPSQ
jgi:Tol biopolymer transport system component